MTDHTQGTDTVQHDPLEDQAEIERHARICMEAGGPGTVLEARLLEFGAGSYKTTASGYFDDAVELAKLVMPKARYAKGVYITPNPVHPGLLARANNRIDPAAGKGSTTSDRDVVRRLWLLLDLDAVRPAGIPSSDDEHAAALERMRQIVDHLTSERCWPAPLRADSGNGGHAMWRIDLPVDDGGLVERCLKALAIKFDDSTVKVDTSVFNPSRIWKLYGTVARKGESIPGRPRRLSRILELPDQLTLVTREQLEGLAAEVPASGDTRAPRAPTSSTNAPRSRPLSHRPGSSSRLETWLAEAGIEHREPFTDSQGRTIFNLVACPFNGAHGGTSVCVGEMPNGAVFFRCHHNSCSGRRWADLRDLVGRPLQGSSSSDADRPKITYRPQDTTRPDASPDERAPKIDARAARLLAAASQLPDDPRSWRWLGSMAARRGAAERVREVTPEAQRQDYDAGVEAHARGDRVARPEITEALAARIVRVLLGLAYGREAAGGGEQDIQILELVRRTAGEGRPATFDIVVATGAGAVHLHGLDERALLQYETIRAACVGQGLALPALGRKGNEEWAPIVAEALERERVEAPVSGEVLDDVLESTVRRLLRDAPRSAALEDLEAGHVLTHADRLIVRTDALLRLVRRALPDDRFERADVARVARRLGVVDRPVHPDGSRPRGYWAFLAQAAEEAAS